MNAFQSLTRLWLASGILLGSFVFFSCSNSVSLITYSGETMGTTYKISIASKDKINADRLKQRTDEILIEFNNVFSTYQKESEISRVNQEYKLGSGMEDDLSLVVSARLADEIRKSLRISKLTEGAFDITVAPLVNMWGFGEDEKEILPSLDELDDVKNLVGFARISLEEDTLSMPKGYRLDFSAIAKGTAVDMVASFLEDEGQNDYLVEIGGEIVVKGNNANGEAWRIQVVSPSPDLDSAKTPIIASPRISERMAVATSGDYINYREVDGKRLSHIINPVSMKPSEHRLSSVSVISSECYLSDALATALMVMGEKEGFVFAEREGLAAFFIYKTDDGFETLGTSEFMQYAEFVE